MVNALVHADLLLAENPVNEILLAALFFHHNGKMTLVVAYATSEGDEQTEDFL